MSFEGKNSFESLKNDDDFINFMLTSFPTLAPKMPLLEETIKLGKRSKIWDLKCYPWTYDKVCLIGDSAHAIFPFYG